MKKTLSAILILIIAPLIIYFGSVTFKEKGAVFMILALCIIAIIPFFLSFEKNATSGHRLALTAVMTALSVFGRFAFTLFPGFKPVTAITIAAGMYLGAEAGFMCGAMSALISNFYFMQGPWTVFQMLSWGISGFIAGLFAPILKKKISFVLIYGVFSGILYSAILDVWTVIWYDGIFNLSRFAVIVVSSAPTTVTYVISNVFFLTILVHPLGKKLTRIINKYG